MRLIIALALSILATGALDLSASWAQNTVESKELSAARKKLDDALRRYTDLHPDVISLRERITTLEKQGATLPPSVLDVPDNRTIGKPSPKQHNPEPQTAENAGASPPTTNDSASKDEDRGADAQAIARWDAVPYRVVGKPTNLGVVAFHINGIDRVEFSIAGDKIRTVRIPSLNKRTGVREYHFTFESDPISLDTELA